MKHIKKFSEFYTPSSLATKAYVDSLHNIMMVDKNFNTRFVDIGDIEKERLLTRRKNIIQGI